MQVTEGTSLENSDGTWIDIRFKGDIVRVHRPGHVGKFYDVA